MMGITPAALTLRGDVLACTAVLTVAHDALGILHGHFACALHEQYRAYGNGKKEDDLYHKHDETALAAGRSGETACELVKECSREAGDDTYKDDEGDTIANAAVSDALSEPHDEHGAGREDDRQERNRPEAHVGTACGGTHLDLEIYEICRALEKQDEHSQVAGVLAELLASAFTFALHLLE